MLTTSEFLFTEEIGKTTRLRELPSIDLSVTRGIVLREGSVDLSKRLHVCSINDSLNLAWEDR